MRFLFTGILVFILTCGYAQHKRVDDIFYKYQKKTIDTRDLLNKTKSRSADGKIFMKIDEWDLELENSDILAPGYRFINEKGEELTSQASRPIPLNGYTSKGGRVSITIAEDFIYGFINDGSDLYYIEPATYYSKSRNKDEFILYNTKDIKPSAPTRCGYEEEKHRKYFEEGKPTNSRQVGLCYDVEYAIVNDWSMYNKYGAAGLEARNIAITNDVNTNYAADFADEIRMVITGQYNSTCSSCNPFGVTTDLGTTLDNFTSWGSSTLDNPNSGVYIPHDVASFWSDVFANSGTVGLAWLGVICSNYKYNVLSDLSTNANTLRVLTAHELGHNFSAGHDASGSGFIMAPSVNNTNTWSSASISSINTHVSTRTCLSLCSDYPATVYFSSEPSSVLEAEGSGTGGSCQENYTEYTAQISISKAPSDNVSVALNTNGSTATNGYDYQLITNSITFTPSGPLNQLITYRIYDDAVVESSEAMNLNFVITSGTAEASSNNSINVSIISNDMIETLTTGAGDTFVYGYEPLSLAGSGFFEGGRSDVRSRFLIRASELSTLGITAGEIDMMAFYVYVKNSTGTYNNFRIGMTEITQPTLDGVGWLSTSTVFTGNVQTVVSAWNSFDFSTPFEWDGTSNIYVEMCYDNVAGMGSDQIVLYDTGNANAQMCAWSTNSLNQCGTVTNYTYYYDRAPYLLLRQKGSTEAETNISALSTGRIKLGETANLFSENGRIIASIKNIGSTNLQCIDATVRTSGSNKNTLPFASGDYTDKTIEINVDGSSEYELTLYYTDEELAIWGVESSTLNFVKTTSLIASSSSGSFSATTSVNTNIGAENVVAYKTTGTGSGYYALTNGEEEAPVAANVTGTFQDADIVIQELSKGVLMKNSAGDQYILAMDGSGSPTLTLNNTVQANAYLPSGDLCVITPGKCLMIKHNASSYTELSVDNDGFLSTVNTTVVPNQCIELQQGHLGLVDAGAGIIFQNMQNECYKLYVNVNGTLTVSPTGCP